MEFSINQLASLLGGVVHGDGTATIKKVSTLENAEAGCISFLHNSKYEPLLYTTRASAVIINKSLKLKEPVKAALIAVEDPYHSLTKLLGEYERISLAEKEGVEDPAFLGKGSKVGEKTYRGAFSYIGHQVVIGDNVKIFPHSYIGDHVRIGDNTVVHSGVKIYAKTIIGRNCVLHSGAVIGSDGFGFVPQEDGSYKAIPQLGNVVLEDEVCIGANTTIDCATLESTIIRKGVKLDNLIQIAHNVELGENTAVAAQAGISGSTKVGRNCVIAGQVGIIGHLNIADRVTIGAQSGISKSIEENGAILMGSPAFELSPYKRSYAVFKNLPKIAERINELEKKVINLPPSKK